MYYSSVLLMLYSFIWQLYKPLHFSTHPFLSPTLLRLSWSWRVKHLFLFSSIYDTTCNRMQSILHNTWRSTHPARTRTQTQHAGADSEIHQSLDTKGYSPRDVYGKLFSRARVFIASQGKQTWMKQTSMETPKLKGTFSRKKLKLPWREHAAKMEYCSGKVSEGLDVRSIRI